MKIGICSDVHNDWRALLRAIKEMGPVDHYLCAGDIVSQYRVSNETLDIMREYGVLGVRGNHEDAIMSSAGIMLRRSGTIKPENLKFLENLPSRLIEDVDGKRVVMVHISPLDPGYEGTTKDMGSTAQMSSGGGGPENESFTENQAPENPLGLVHDSELAADILVLGNTHKEAIRWHGKTLIGNPGSLGEPRNPDYPHRRTFIVLDTDAMEPDLRWFEQAMFE